MMSALLHVVCVSLRLSVCEADLEDDMMTW